MRLTGSDFYLLRVFEAVARNGGLSAAQAELNLSQSTISNHMTALEQRLGFQLCQRGRKGFHVSDRGLMVLEIARAISQDHDDYSLRLSEMKGNLVGRLRIGIVDCVATDANFKLPEAISAFLELAREADLLLETEPPQALLRKVLDGQIHVAFGSFETRISGLAYEQLHTESHYLYCSDRHSLFSVPMDQIDVNQLSSFSAVHRGYGSNSVMRRMNVGYLDGSAEQIEPQLLLILSGRYIGLLPDHFARPWVERGRLRCLLPEQTHDEYAFQMVTRAGKKSILEKAFIDQVRLAFRA